MTGDSVSDEQLVSALRAALKENERLRRLTEAASEPIAIIGMGCRLPGGIRGPRDLWDVVTTGTDAVGPCPGNRGWDEESRAYSAGFIDADRFDAGFFGMGEREALATEPQQRVLLEVAWETIEHARIDPGSLRGSRTAVFAGAMAVRYDTPAPPVSTGAGNSADIEIHQIAGLTGSMVSARIAYALDLHGLAVTLDAACPSSLVGLHLAGRALRAGDCDLALVGGVKVVTDDTMHERLRREGQIAPDGRIKAYSAAADGMDISEGAGMVLLERLSDATRHGHRVLAVVRGSAVNHIGARGNGPVVANGPTQRQVIRAALADAGLASDQIDAVEGNGTGTSWGDPLEIQALLDTYGSTRAADRPLWLGSVKSNVGNTITAAGIAGLIKMVEALQRGVLPKTLHVDRPTPHVDWAGGAVELLTENTPWPDNGRTRRGAVTSLGGNGSAAHVILEQAPPLTHKDIGSPDNAEGAHPLWVLSAKTPQGLRDRASDLLAYWENHPELDPLDVAWSLATTRTHFHHRAVVTGDKDTLRPALTALAEDRAHPDLRTDHDSEGVDSTAGDYLRRLPVDWPAVFTGAAVRQVDLPTYPFQHRSYWSPAGGRDV
jgi:acyl transferase domain-containing protein